MKVLLLALAICASTLLAQKTEATVTSSQPTVHVSSTFNFTVNAPLQEAAPLFGPEGERAWRETTGTLSSSSLCRHRTSKARSSRYATVSARQSG